MRTQPHRVTFPGSTGASLDARLDLPAGPPRAFAVFAHCFTCSKDLRAATEIAVGLTDAGFGVLRFDFTGLGQSGGEFANTDFTSNAVDLVHAADWLREHHRAPQLLVGHSLGGAAVVAAAGDIAEVKAVATVNAPSDPRHVAGLFEGQLEDINTDGSAEVCVAGREFTIRRDFVEDLHGQRVLDQAAALDAALLVLHSPIDQVVSVDHAAALYGAARHPKGYVSLDGADHLLSDRHDARYAATMIAAFASRYIDDQSGALSPPAPTAPVVVAETGQGTFLNHVVAGSHRLLADEPEAVGGFDAGPAPYDFLGAALGSCTSMTLRLYADRKALPVTRIAVEVTHGKVHVDDLGESVDIQHVTPIGGRIDRFERAITIEGDIDDAQRERMLQIADRCPVHRTLEASALIDTRLTPAD